MIAVNLADDRQGGLIDGKVSEAENYAYRFSYSSLIEGVPLAYLGDIVVDSEYSGIRLYEKIELMIDNEGIAQFTWNSPMEVTEILTTETNIIDFDTAAERFEQLMTDSYRFRAMNQNDEYAEKRIDFVITEVRLNMVRIKDPKSSFSDYFVPAYVFYGIGYDTTVMHENEGGEKTVWYIMSEDGSQQDYPGEIALIMINAIDGTRINPSEGY